MSRWLNPLFRWLLVATVATLAIGVRVALSQDAPTRRVAVAAHTVARGMTLTADDITYRDTTLRAGDDTTAVSAGWVTRRLVVAGEPLRSPAVQPPIVVNANQAIECEWQGGGVRITVRGTAARNATMGERIPVRLAGGRRVDGTVVAPGRIKLD